MTDFPFPSCWTVSNARDVLVTEALSNDDALFLATHTPVRGFRAAGPTNDMQEATEGALLASISNPDQKHVFCVVEGEPGSGKSHLIRWLDVNWPHDNDLCLLIQRADGSLEGAVKQLQGALGDEFQHLFDKLGRKQDAALAGRAANFLALLANALDPGHFSKRLSDVDWCAENDPTSLLLNNAVRRSWTGPLRVLEIMDGSAGNRNSASASFSLEDIPSLAKYWSDVHDSPSSERLARRLGGEAPLIQDLLDQGLTPDSIKKDYEGQVRHSIALIDALNLRKNYAVQGVIGISADGLMKLFEELRRELGKRNRRLVLLLEDITSWEGLDDSLIDALILDTRTRRDDELCPLISVVGVTPEYFERLRANYYQRITHEINLGDGTGQLQDVALMREGEVRDQFVARYMNAARVGFAPLAAWREDVRKDHSLTTPNACLTCPRLERCHRIYGQVDNVGLFPFTSVAIDNFFSALVSTGRMTHKTPRGLIQAVLGPTLLNPQALDVAAYPGAHLDTTALDPRPFPNVLLQRLKIEIADETELERYRRLYTYWGNLRSELTVDGAGVRSFAGVSEEIGAAFGLRWLSDDLKPTAPMADPRPTVVAEPISVSPTIIKQETVVVSPPIMVAPTVSHSDPSTQAKPSPAARPAVAPKMVSPSRAQFNRNRDDISAIRQKAALQNPSFWNATLSDMVRAMDYKKADSDRWTWARIFTAENVKIEGTGQTQRRHFVVPREEWVADGLDAFIALKSGDLPSDELQFSMRRFAFFQRKLFALARARVNERVPTNSDGTKWNPVFSVVQTLLARSWLRGATSAERTSAEQWIELLSEESLAESDPSVRVSAWQDILNGTKNLHETLRKALIEMVRLPQGESTNFGISDASDAAYAVQALVRTCRLTPTPDVSPDSTLGEIETVRSTAARLASLQSVASAELRQLTGRGKQVFDRLDGQEIGARLSRIDSIVSTISDQLPEVLSQKVRDWKTSLQRGRRFVDEAEVTEPVEDLVISLRDPVAWDIQGSALLCQLAAAPASDLRSVLELLQLGDQLVEDILPHVRDMVNEISRGASLEAVHNYGAELLQAAQLAKSALGLGAPS